MKKVSKFILASSLILDFSVTPELFNVTQAHAQESVKPYYNYSGFLYIRVLNKIVNTYILLS